MPCVTEVKGRRAKENAQPHFSCCFPSRMWRGCPLIKSTSGCPTWPTRARSLLLWREIFSIPSRSSVKFVCVCGGDEREIMNLFHDSNGSFPLSAIVLTVRVGGQSYRSSGDCICFSVCIFRAGKDTKWTRSSSSSRPSPPHQSQQSCCLVVNPHTLPSVTGTAKQNGN